MKTCPNCKAQLEDDVVFCNECGTKVDSAPAQTEETASSDASSTSNAAPAGNSILENAAQTTKNSNIGIIAVAVVALVLIVILIAILGGGGGAKGAIKSYFAALE
ncbi:MAG: zinc-ribbon domain-containing protein, partial [Lachnospiraceae bacterium]|nr:zinc-ribbon domain-containing protein [Lachnospiraceae bacterium]